MTETERRRDILHKLQKTYPDAQIMLTYQNPWELLVAVILSAQCTDKMVNTVTPRVFTTYKTVDAMAHANPSDLEQLVRKTGFYKHKANHIIAAAKRIVDHYQGNVPNTMEQLLTLPGVARKTANVVLTNAFHTSEGIAVDTHVIRLSQRLRFVDMEKIGGKQIRYVETSHKTIDFIKDADPVKIEQQLMQWVPREWWGSTTYQVIDHGRAVCKAVSPSCHHCPLAPLCPTRR